MFDLKIDQLFRDKFGFENMKFLVKVKDNHKTEKKISVSVFCYGNKVKYPI